MKIRYWPREIWLTWEAGCYAIAEDIKRLWNKIDEVTYWFFAVTRGYLKALWQRVVWNIRWPFLWLGYQARQVGLFFRTLKLTGAHIEDEGKHTVVIRLKWESEIL